MPDAYVGDRRPWAARKPQSYVMNGILIALAIALVWQGFAYINAGTGGLVPYLIILGGPVLAIYYTWYFSVRRFESDGPAGG
ncbi:MAG: hypothetical protein HQ453_04900 [Actinobacteria bacterium]|nr:hypothetical protein [Actinomycetota bacterium]